MAGAKSRFTILVTNDDGIFAPGLRALVGVLVAADRYHVNVCAPDSEMSAVGHSITVRNSLHVSQGYRVTRQGKSMIKTMWKRIDSHSAGTCVTGADSSIDIFSNSKHEKEVAVGHNKSSLKNIEVVSVPSTGENDLAASSDECILFKREISEFEYGEEGEDMDFGAVENGYKTITPIAAMSNAEAKAHTYLSDWPARLAEYSASSAL